jgi:hypothetical protein
MPLLTNSVSRHTQYRVPTVLYVFYGGANIKVSTNTFVINRVFGDFQCTTGIYLGTFGFPCISIEATHEPQGPQAERSANPISLRFPSKRNVSRRRAA